MSIIELIISPFYLYFFYWIISNMIFVYRNNKELERHFGKNFNKLIRTDYKRVIRQKNCTQTQPFIKENENIICNFPCDGKCQLINYEKD